MSTTSPPTTDYPALTKAMPKHEQMFIACGSVGLSCSLVEGLSRPCSAEEQMKVRRLYDALSAIVMPADLMSALLALTQLTGAVATLVCNQIQPQRAQQETKEARPDDGG